MGFGEPENAEAGAEPLFGMRAVAKDDVDQGCGIGTNRTGAAAKAFRRPVGEAAVGAGLSLRSAGTFWGDLNFVPLISLTFLAFWGCFRPKSVGTRIDCFS